MNMRDRRRGGWRVVLVAVALAGAGGRANAMTYRPLSDENLVAASALIVIGQVEQVRGARLANGRVVTQTELRVDATLKGRVASPRILVTEPGGRAGGVMVRIPGVPQFTPGERILVFLRERADGTLGTTALSLAKYTIASGASARATARRTSPDFDERQLDQFDARIRQLAGSTASRVVSDGFAGPPAVDVRVDAFTLLDNAGDCDPIAFAGCIGGRWFQARCGESITYSLSGSDGGVGPLVSRQAVDAALAAWSSAPGGFIDLLAGPDVPAVPSSLAPTSLADFDGQNVVQFEDPYEIVPDLVGCQGVLALGGTVSTPQGRIVQDDDTSFDRTLEGDVVVNQGTGACLGEGGLAETLAHEIGHTLGFGHSSENQFEPDAVLSDALMYFMIHDDGRGATLQSDDLAGLAYVYGPPVGEPMPAGEALRDAACLLDIDLWSSACFLDQEELGGFPVAPLKKAAKAGRFARKAHAAPKTKKQLRLLRKADRQLAKAETKLDGLQSNGTLRAECAGALLDSVALGRVRIAEAQAVVAAGL